MTDYQLSMLLLQQQFQRVYQHCMITGSHWYHNESCYLYFQVDQVPASLTTRSPAVARIANRTASQQTSNYSDCVNRPSILWVYQLNLEETKTYNSASSSVQVEVPWRQWAGAIGAACVVFRDIIAPMKLHCASVSHFAFYTTPVS